MECEGSAFFYSHDEEAVSLFSLLERELRELSPILSLCLLQKKEKRGQTSRFFSLLQLFFSSFVLSRKIMEKKGNLSSSHLLHPRHHNPRTRTHTHTRAHTHTL